jgi:hypothetical protein
LAKEHPEQFVGNSLRFIRCGTGAASPALMNSKGPSASQSSTAMG